MISRRHFLTIAAALAAHPSLAAPSSKVWRIGYLAPGNQDDPVFLQSFLSELKTMGYIPGESVVLEHRSAEGRFEMLPALARDLLSLNVDVIVAPTTPVARAAKEASSGIPIVFTIVSDPVGSGLVKSFSHPEGNATGVTDVGVDLVPKQIDLLKQLVPKLKSIGIVGNPKDRVWESVWQQAPEAARRLHLNVVPVLASTPPALKSAFVNINRRVQALLVAPQVFFSVNRWEIVELAASAKLPAIHELRSFPEAGALMSYGPDYSALFRKAAHYVDRIFKGAKPGDIPVEQPTEYELVINQSTADALRVTIPKGMLLAAKEIIH